MSDLAVLVLLPAQAIDEDMTAPPGCTLVAWHTSDDIVRALYGEFEAAVLMSDGLEEADLAPLIAAIRDCGKPIVEVRGDQWDGFAPMPLASACKGVVSGFGRDGVWAAVGALRS